MGEMASDGDFRSSLVNELHELIAFLQARLSEAGSMQILRGSQGAHTLLEPVPSATLKQWLQVRLLSCDSTQLPAREDSDGLLASS